MATIHIKRTFKQAVKAGIDEDYRKRSKVKPKMSTMLSIAKYKSYILENDLLHLWTGIGTERAEKLGEAECRGVERIEIVLTNTHRESGVVYFDGNVKLNNAPVSLDELKKIARLDGFESVDLFLKHYTTKRRPVFKGLRILWGSTYKRKYFLHREVKKAGFGLQLEETHKTICVPWQKIAEAKTNRYVKELQNGYGYGVSFMNPLMNNTPSNR